MMYTAILVVSMAVGQPAYCQPIYQPAYCQPIYQPAYCQPIYPACDVVHYHMGDMQEVERFFAWLEYGTQYRRVPVINGYAPRITISTYPNGAKYVLYDYRQKIPVRLCKIWNPNPPRQAPLVEPRQAPEPKQAPFIEPAPLKIQPIDPDERRPAPSLVPPESEGSMKKRASSIGEPEQRISPRYSNLE